jgi:glycosyltransferase involved in cell wall biosynthesis
MTALAPVVHVVAAGEVGGAERMLARLADPSQRHLGAGPIRPHLVALWTDDRALAALFTGAGIAVAAPPARAGRRLSARLRATGGPDVAWLAAHLSSVGAAAVHLHTFASHVLGTRAGLRAGVPVVRTEHSLRVYDNWLCRPFSSWSLRRAARVVTVSAHLGRVIAGRFPELDARLTVIANGVTLPAPATTMGEGPDSGPLRLSLVARLEPRKAVDRALRAVARVPGTCLDIVGDGPLRAELERLSSALGLSQRVRFWGYRPDPERVVSASDAALCSSRTEGLPLNLLEAMALGRPAVAVPVGGVPEIVSDGDNGWLASAATLDALTAALAATAAASRTELRRRGERARLTIASRFTDAHMRQAYEEVYRSLPVTTASARAVQAGGQALARIRA